MRIQIEDIEGLAALAFYSSANATGEALTSLAREVIRLREKIEKLEKQLNKEA